VAAAPLTAHVVVSEMFEVEATVTDGPVTAALAGVVIVSSARTMLTRAL